MTALRSPAPSRRYRGLAVAVAAVAVGLGVGGCTSGGDAGPGPALSTAPAHPTGSPSLGRPDDVTGIGIGGAPVGLAYGFRSVWVAGTDIDTVLRIDPQGTIVAQVKVGQTPLRLAVVPRGVWVSEFRAGSVALVDPTTQAVTTRVTVGAQPEGLATDGTHLWVVLQQDRRLAELDAATGAVVRTVQLPADGEPRLAAYAPAGPGRRATVWVSDYGGDRVVPVDAATGKVGTPVAACAAPQAVAVGGRTLWVACQDGWLATVDLTTHRAARVTDLRQMDGSPDAITVADGAVWTALSTGPVVLRVDPATERVTGRHEVADDGPLTNADVDVLVADGQVWVSSFNGQAVHHVALTDVASP
jgi:YVTN family beta-propeller protein